MAVNRQMRMLARVLIRGSYINETGGIRSLFRLNVAKDCSLVSLNHALVRLDITPVSVDSTQVRGGECLENSDLETSNLENSDLVNSDLEISDLLIND